MHQLLPRVYVLKKTKEGYYYPEQYKLFYETPKKLYGNILNNANHFWRAYKNSTTSMGVMLVGASGAGKSSLAELLSNIAMSNDMPVVIISNITADIELISYLDSLGDVMVVFDEFAKVFDYNLQEKMLSMFSALGGGKKFFIITENDPRHISRYIRDRPGRMRYRIDFGRVTEEVLNEYYDDHSSDAVFKADLLEKYRESLEFSFDHLKAIVQEHLENPGVSFEDTISILNLEVLTRPITYHVSSITSIVDNEVIEFTDRSVQKNKFNHGETLFISLVDRPENIRLRKNDVVSVEDDEITCVVNNKYRVVLTKG